MNSATKKSDLKSEATKKRIVAGLEACIVKFGYAQTKWVDIADAAELSTPHLRYYFKNKESILEYQYEHLVQQFAQAVYALPQTLDANWFSELAHLIFDTKRRSRESLMILMQANIVTAHSAPLQALKQRYDQQILAAIESQLEHLEVEEAPSVAEIIFNLLSGLMLNTAFKSKGEKEQAIALFLQFVHMTTRLDVTGGWAPDIYQSRKLMTNYGYRTTATEVVADINLTGKRAIVTGGYSGIGLETARALALAGANVTIACRDLPRARDTAASINQALGHDRVHAGELDLGNLASVRRFAQAYATAQPMLDILVNNAAVMACPHGHTNDGFELQFGTNHLGHFALFQGLLSSLRAAEGARVVCLSSTGHFLSPVVFEDIQFEHRDYDPWSSYGQAKTANALMAAGIQARYEAESIEGFAVHPGGIMTNLQRHMTADEILTRGWVDEQGNVNELFKTTEQGASTSVWAATSPDLLGRGGRYLEDCGEATVLTEPSADFTGVMQYAVDLETADRLWSVSLSLLEEAA